MTIASRTPEGEPWRCPVCGNELRLDPSRPPGDAPCPHCGTLLWFPPNADEPPRLASPPLQLVFQSSDDPRIRRQTPAANPPPLPFQTGDRVRVADGMFAAKEGVVLEIPERQ